MRIGKSIRVKIESSNKNSIKSISRPTEVVKDPQIYMFPMVFPRFV